MYDVLAVIALIVTGVLLFLVLFEPGLKYCVKPSEHPLDSEDFLCLVGVLADAQVRRDSRADVLTNGNVFYEAELEAIKSAKRSINLEAYIFQKDNIGKRYVE